MDAAQIARLRSFNRTVSQRIGALDDRFLDRGRPLGEARLLYEIGHGGAEVRALRARLELDSGYVSRLLRSLERQRLVTGERAAGDGRVRRVRLTAKGRREVAELDRRADAFARSMLAPLGAAQQARLIAAMTEVERLMRASAVRIAAEPADSADARWCVAQYFRELGRRFDAGFDPARSISADAHELTPPAGVFVIARLGGRPIGCGALKVKQRRIGEVKRMWVDAEARGLGIGRRLLAALEAEARKFGLGTLRLETNRSLVEAQALYRRAGYREVAPFNDEPYAHHWFEKRLRPARTGSWHESR
ncbi:MAG TPA: helix-turn-helix domain-containing GNAT family N-acetyltransferase [Stellaceae bacterium]|nr:helix-turn-helix domain-containing GNAT family N-acetyltransferase [Stellaceae bacterium]